MKKAPIMFLQTVLVLIGLAALALLIRMPLTEGRAKDLDLLHIYLDPFILYGYVASLAFFAALYQGFRLLGFVRRNQLFSTEAVRTVKMIKYCAIALGVFIALGGVYIRFFHHPDDDPAGFLALSMAATFMAAVAATAVAVFENVLKNAVDLKSENDLTI